MLLIPCPWCGPRPENEFHYGGEAHVARPADPAAVDDAAWADFLYMRDQSEGAACRAVAAHAWLRPVFQLRARHGERPDRCDLQAGRGAAAMTTERFRTADPADGSIATGRFEFSFDGRSV